MVMTRFDIRIYDSRQGQLKEVLTDVLKKSNKNQLHLTKYIEGHRSRKFYLGDNFGNVRIFNMKNGEMLKEVSNIAEEKEVLEELG